MMLGSVKVYPQRQQSLKISVPSSNAIEEEDDEHSQKRAGDSFELDELFDLNGADFWFEFFREGKRNNL